MDKNGCIHLIGSSSTREPKLKATGLETLSTDLRGLKTPRSLPP